MKFLAILASALLAVATPSPSPTPQVPEQIPIVCDNCTGYVVLDPLVQGSTVGFLRVSFQGQRGIIKCTSVSVAGELATCVVLKYP